MGFPKRASGRKGNDGGWEGGGGLVVASSKAIRNSAAGAAPIESDGCGVDEGVMHLIVGCSIHSGNFVGVSG